MKPKVIQKIVAGMGYDFSQFTLAGFVDWIAQQRGKPIRLEPCPTLPAGISGMWLSSLKEEVICYQSDLPPLRKQVTIFHELAHIYLGHQTLVIDDLPLAFVDLIRDAGNDLAYRDAFAKEDDEEAAAEAMALFLLKRVLACGQDEADSITPGSDYMKSLQVLS